MRYFALLVVAALLVGCERDAYMGRKGGYMPGEPYQHQSGLYPGMQISQVGA